MAISQILNAFVDVLGVSVRAVRLSDQRRATLERRTPSAVALLIAIIGFVVSFAGGKSGIGMPVAGGVIALLAIGLAILSTGGFAAAVGAAAANAQAQRTLTNQTTLGGSPPSLAPPATPRARAAAEEEERAPAASGVRQGDVDVLVSSATIGIVRLKSILSEDESQSTSPVLSVTMELKNTGRARKLEYRSWRGSAFDVSSEVATLKDEHGNRYQRVAFSSSRLPDDAVNTASLYPGKSSSDVLIFQPPIDAAQKLRLELPARNFGGTGMIRLEIPRSMISVRR